MTENLSRTYRLGMIGYGDYATFLIQTWRSLPKVEIAAIAGRTEDAVKQSAEELGIPKCYSGEDSAEELIADPDLDIVVIATPPFTHAEMAERALRAGKHVLCEKPLAITADDAGRVCRAVKETGNRLAMGFVLRYDPLFDRLKRLVDERVFGELHRIDFQNFAGDEALPPDHWFWDVSKSGGILVEHGVHFFDIYTWLLGSEPRRITGHRTVRPGTAQEDRVMATVEYENGALASFYHAFDKPSRLEKTTARLAFDRGYMEVDGWIALTLEFDAALEPGDRDRLGEILPGWVQQDVKRYAEAERPARGGGNDYLLEERVKGCWTLSEDKQAVYEDCARRELADLLQGIDDPSHAIQADVEAGLRSVRIATAVPPPDTGE
ncbi:MAG: Gfo/Idh/MocA family oxidoreductase [Armatimonadetes bacterium]|nr:Gfo/Idh/MocA family oxidoreductase [Armatimonadota bacterium]